MLQYLEPFPYEPQRRSSSNLKMIAVIIIFMLLISGGLLMLLPLGDLIRPTSGSVKVAVIDSGIDIDYSLQGRIANQTSFVLTEYGYLVEDTTLTDSAPDGSIHGTVVAKEIASLSSNAIIVNAKILGASGTATTSALIAAIRWSVDMNCSVINLSLGSLPSYEDPLEEVIAWAFDRGVILVAAAGNEGEDGIAGNQINSPAVFEKCLAVAGLTEFGNPASFTSPGPTASRYMKPDLAAQGYFDVGTYRYSGTSFAAPRVSAAAADLIAFCTENGIAYTAGSIMTALMKGAVGIPHPEYMVGAGQLSVQNSKDLILSQSTNGSLPAITYVHPRVLPIDYERMFYGDTFNFSVQVFTSGLTTYEIDVDSDEPTMFVVPTDATINQTGQVPITVEIPSYGATRYESHITFTSSSFGEATLSVDFDVSTAVARVAFDISYTTWFIDTTYGQFRDFYRLLTDNDISVTEIRDESHITLSYLQEFDAVVLLDAFAWDTNESDPDNIEWFSLPFDPAAAQAYHDYYDGGGGVFVAALSNESLDIAKINDFISWSGYSFGFSEIADGYDTVEVTPTAAHTITSAVGSFDYLGAPIVNVPGNSSVLGQYLGSTVLSSVQGAGGGRMVVTGTNFFIDNWGINELYSSTHNDRLALQIVKWISDLI